MSHNPNTVKSQDDLPTTNDGKRSSDVLIEAISKAERLQKQLDIAVKALEDYAESDNWELENEKYIYWAKKGQPYPWRLGIKALKEIEELNR